MRIPDEIFDEITRANDIVDVISSYISVKRRGSSFIALCPFHPDKNPSMHISQTKQVYHCFSCKAGGNVITFVQDYEKITGMEAVERLAQRAGINLGAFARRPDLSNEIARLFDINTKTARYFYDNLVNIGGEEKKLVSDYIKKRGLDEDIIRKFGIGYSSNNWHSLMNNFTEDESYTLEELELAGLVIKAEKDGKYHDRFRGRLIFPIFNESGKVVGFGGRILTNDKETAKYINSPETRVYSKSKILYGLNFAKDSIRSKDYVILVEGYMDVVSLFHAGIKNVVASSGTALTIEQVHLISRYTKNIVLLYDADVAGIKAAKRGIEIILEQGLDLSIVSLPDGEDPDSFVRTKGVEEFEKSIAAKKSIITFISDIYKKEGNLATPESKTDFIKEIISYIVRIPDRIKISFYIKELAETYRLYESDMRDELNRAYKEFKKTLFPKTSVALPERKSKEKKDGNGKHLQAEYDIIKVFLSGNFDAINYIADNIYIDYITDEKVLGAVEIMLDEWHNENKIDVSKLVSQIEDEEIRKILLTESTPKFEITKTDFLPADSILARVENESVNYLKLAKDIIQKLKLMDINRKIRGSFKDTDEHAKGIDFITEKTKIIKRK
ncbi:MAG: DNA primase [Ignavibacteria bacterium]|nr:DNA primase [Ignavibacteria bacterium]